MLRGLSRITSLSTPPDGMFIEGLYWESLTTSGPVGTRANYQRGDRASISVHAEDATLQPEAYSYFGLQIAGGSAVKRASAFVLAAALILLFVSHRVRTGALVFRGEGSLSDPAALGTLMALPGFAIGLVSQLQAQMTGYLTSWLRASVNAVSLLPPVVGVLVACGASSRLVWLSAYLGGLACLWVGLLLGSVGWNRRWPGLRVWTVGEHNVINRWVRIRRQVGVASLVLVTLVAMGVAGGLTAVGSPGEPPLPVLVLFAPAATAFLGILLTANCRGGREKSARWCKSD